MDRKLRRSKGFTYSLIHKSSPRRGFALSVIKGAEERIKGTPTANQIERYIDKYAKLLKGEGMHVGGWYNPEDGHTYLDVSLIEQDRDRAIALAQKYNQLAIFDLKTKTTITTPKKVAAASEPQGIRFYFRPDADPQEIAEALRKLAGE